MIKLPDELTPKAASRAYGGQVEGYRDGWNACLAEVQHLNATAQPDNSNDGYVKAFYEIASILGISAQSNSPRHVFETVMKPKLQDLVSTTQPVSDGWVKCSERMPDDEDYYLTYSNSGIGVEYFNGRIFSDRRLTYWMPLPTAPGGQDD